MKRYGMGLVAAVALMLVSFSSAVAKDMTYTGEIMDSQCAKSGSHDAMMKKGNIPTEKDCTLGCIKMGGKFVLYNADKKIIYQLDDQTKPRDFAGNKVQVMGTYDKATKTIHVTSIKAAS